MKGVTKRFGSALALRDLTLEVEDGEFFVLLGPSGCGKTTALRIVAGLEEPSEGRVYIGDRLMNEVPAKDRDLAMVFQNYALYPHMNVYDNLAFGLRMRQKSRSQIDRLVRDAARALGIDTLLQRKPGQLSGGQRQRVALGRAIVRRPQVYLMDEPLSNLDAMLRVSTRAELVKLHRRLKTTVLYVTHDQVEAMTMGNRMAVLHEGELQQVGSPQEVYDRPANRFVAEFIGSPAMNFMPAEATLQGGQPGLNTADGFVQLPDSLWTALQATATRRVVLGIRPEHLIATTSEDERYAAAFRGKVELVEMLGSEQHVTASLEHASLVFRLSAEVKAEPGANVRLAVTPDHLHMFDAETGRRLD